MDFPEKKRGDFAVNYALSMINLLSDYLANVNKNQQTVLLDAAVSRPGKGMISFRTPSRRKLPRMLAQ
jgi:hypothetical protein